MAFCTPRELVEASATGTGVLQEYLGTPDGCAYPSFSRVYGPITLKRAKAIIEGAKAWTKAHRQVKINRPYELVDITRDLDPDQPWVAWEIECGWHDQPNYDKVIDYLWRYHNHVTVDIEGAGLATEITFCPENADKMFSGKAQVHRFLNWVQRKNIQSVRWNENSCVGTHLNISTPAFRALPQLRKGDVVNTINGLLHNLNQEACRELFGRGSPYGYGFRNGFGERAWIEFKLFNSTIDPRQFARYCNTAKNMVRLMDLVAADPTLSGENVIRINESLETPQMQELRTEYLRVYPWITLATHQMVCINAREFLNGTADKLIYAWQFSDEYKRLARARATELAHTPNEQE